MAVLAGIDFFTADVLTWRGLTTYYVLFVIQLETRRVTIAGVTLHPNEEWMEQTARNLTDADSGALLHQRFLLHDRDTKFCAGFHSILRTAGVEPVRLPASSPNLNAFAERWVRSVKYECLSKLILFGEGSLRRTLNEYTAHYHSERNHQGKANVLLFPQPGAYGSDRDRVECRIRLGGLLRYYARAA
jgi:transposase InsO family protein